MHTLTTYLFFPLRSRPVRSAARRIVAVVLVTLGMSSVLSAQPAPDGRALLDAYVDRALASNLALRQQALSLDASRHALDAARRQFLPAFSVEARFTRAGGGRVIDLPLGDLLNPVYGTLSDLLVAQGSDPAFPTLANEDIAFLRSQEQDTRVRLVQPVYQPRLHAAVRLNRHLVASKEAEVEAFRRALVRDVKTAYFAYLQADRATAILAASADLVTENLRVAERLQASDRALAVDVVRARAETYAVKQQVAEAVRDRDRARAYVNFLLNRPLDAPLDEAGDDAWPLPQPAPWVPPATQPIAGTAEQAPSDPAFDEALAAMQDAAVSRRLELDQLDEAIRAGEAGVALDRAAYLPGLAIALEAGIQGETYGFDGEAPFYLASAVLTWTLFNGGSARARVQEARAEVARTRAQRDEAALQIRLQVQDAFDAVRVARASLTTASQRLAAASEGFRLTQRLVASGQANQVTFVDARTVLTSAQRNLNVTRYDLLARLADLEFAVGGALSN